MMSFGLTGMLVQIPLWTIVTPGDIFDGPSTSVQIPLWTIVTGEAKFLEVREIGSDSSMDDCNAIGRLFAAR